MTRACSCSQVPIGSCLAAKLPELGCRRHIGTESAQSVNKHIARGIAPRMVTAVRRHERHMCAVATNFRHREALEAGLKRKLGCQLDYRNCLQRGNRFSSPSAIAGSRVSRRQENAGLRHLCVACRKVSAILTICVRLWQPTWTSYYGRYRGCSPPPDVLCGAFRSRCRSALRPSPPCSRTGQLGGCPSPLCGLLAA